MSIEAPPMSFPDNVKILRDPNVWVTDSGATCNITPYAEGMKVNKNIEPTNIIRIMGSESSTMFGNLSTVMCDKNGNEKLKLKFQNVAVVPDCAFNLSSLTKQLKNGWFLSCHKKCLTLTKDKIEVRFDIVINTKEGMIIARYFR
jgi:hypothetical protein